MEDKRDKNEAAETEFIDLQVFFGDMWRGFIKFWWTLICFAVIIGGFQFYRYYICYTPRYTCSATYTLHTESPLSVGESGLSAYTFTYNSATTERLSSIFSYAVSSSIVRKRICEDIGLPELPVSIVASCVPDSNLLTFTAIGLDPEMTYAVICSLSKNYNAITDYIIGKTKLVTITEPVLPTDPSNSREWIMSVIKGILLGVFMGVFLIACYALIRSTVRTKEDIRTKLNQRCLGAVPQVTFKKYRQTINTDILLSNPRIGNDFFESMRLLRSSVRVASENRGNVLMVTSTAPGEGKSVVTVNLAAIFAKNKEKVLVIDCDLRNSGIRSLLPMKQMIMQDSGHSCSLYHVESLDIDVLRFDHKSVHPRSILREDFLRKLIDYFKKQYDYVIIDTPPCGIISDAATVARVSDGLIYVVRQDTIMLNSIRSSLNSMMSTDIPLLGCILNGATGGYGGYGSYYNYRGYYHYYRYGSNYGYGKEKKHRRRTNAD